MAAILLICASSSGSRKLPFIELDNALERRLEDEVIDLVELRLRPSTLSRMDGVDAPRCCRMRATLSSESPLSEIDARGEALEMMDNFLGGESLGLGVHAASGLYGLEGSAKGFALSNNRSYSSSSCSSTSSR